MHNFDHILNWRLLPGSHDFPGPHGGTCVNEAAIVAAGFPYRKVRVVSDMPECFCPVLSQYALVLNDGVNDSERQRLLPFVSRLAGTRHRIHSSERTGAMLRHILSTVVPLMLEFYRHYEAANNLRSATVPSFDPERVRQAMDKPLRLLGGDAWGYVRVAYEPIVRDANCSTATRLAMACLAFMREAGNYRRHGQYELFDPFALDEPIKYSCIKAPPLADTIFAHALEALDRGIAVAEPEPVDLPLAVERLDAAKAGKLETA